MNYNYQPYPAYQATNADKKSAHHVPVAIVGAGPIGLAAAIDLAQHGVKSIVVDAKTQVSVGSRAICWAKRTLEIFDRLGIGDRMLEKGVTWKIGRLFNGNAEVYSFDLLPEPDHKYPAFVNLQQYYVEEYLIDRARELSDRIELRFGNEVIDHIDVGQSVELRINSPSGEYPIRCDFLLACDGANSPTRKRMALPFEGVGFEERFLIADVKMTADFPSERWFWFNPPFHNGESALLHKQPDNIYRIDLQLGVDADPDREREPHVVRKRIETMLGHEQFELDWISVYKFRCCRLENFIHQRVIFVGDSAHVVSPFGARGGNGGIQDVDNLCWKLANALNHGASPELLESYNEERGHGANENIANSTRSTNFMSPPTPNARRFRDALLALAHEHPFAQQAINSGRLSKPCTLRNTRRYREKQEYAGFVKPGQPCPDAKLSKGWLIECLDGQERWIQTDPSVPLQPEVIDATGSSSAQTRLGVGMIKVGPDQHILWAGPVADARKVLS